MVEREKLRERKDDIPFGRKAAKPESIEAFEDVLHIDRNALDEALIEQPELYFRISDQLALAISKRDAAKHELELTEAEVNSTIRLHESDNGKKITDKSVAAEVIQHRDVQGAQKNLIYLTHQAARWQALQGSMSQRSYVLKDLVALHLKAYYSAEAAGAASPRTQMYDHNRREMQEERSKARDPGREREARK